MDKAQRPGLVIIIIGLCIFVVVGLSAMGYVIYRKTQERELRLKVAKEREHERRMKTARKLKEIGEALLLYSSSTAFTTPQSGSDTTVKESTDWMNSLFIDGHVEPADAKKDKDKKK